MIEAARNFWSGADADVNLAPAAFIRSEENATRLMTAFEMATGRRDYRTVAFR